MTKTNVPAICKALLICCLAVTVCGGMNTVEAGGKQMNSIHARVVYLNKMMLPPDSTVTVTLWDVSKMDVRADLLSTQTVKADGGPPYLLTLDYDADMIDEKMRYSLRAVIENRDQLLYTSTDNIDPFSSSAADPIDITVSPVTTTAEPSKAVHSLSNTAWKLTSLNGIPAAPGAEGKDVSLSFSADGRSVTGYSGCNTFNGSFESSGDTLTFGLMASTMRMCSESEVMELELSFHKALEGAERFEINGDELTIIDGRNTPLAIFKSE